MTDTLVRIVAWLNVAANAVGSVVLAPFEIMPGWLSATLASVVIGVLMLLVFKYTSNQRAIKKVRSDIKANLLALKLFKDNPWVIFQSQGGLLTAAFWLLVYAVIPMLVMFVPMLLILTQLSLWYQTRPLKVDDVAVLTVKLNGAADAPWPTVKLQESPAIEVEVGPVRAQSKRTMDWRIKARQPGYHRLVFLVDGQEVTKELAIGDGFMRVSAQRPSWSLLETVEHPSEPPFESNSTVQFIGISYAPRDSAGSGNHAWPLSWWCAFLNWTSSNETWVYYLFIASMVAALCFRRVFNVNL